MDGLLRLMIGCAVVFVVVVAYVLMTKKENFERIARRGTNIRKDGAGHMNAHGLGVNPGRGGGMPVNRNSIYGTLPNNAPQSILGQNLYGYDKEPIAGASRSDLRNILTPDSPYYVPPNNRLYALGGAYNRPRGRTVQADAFTGDLATFNDRGARSVSDFQKTDVADLQGDVRRRTAAARARAATLEAQRTAIQAQIDADNAAPSEAVQNSITAQLAAQEAANAAGSRVEARMRPMPNVGNVLNTL